MYAMDMSAKIEPRNVIRSHTEPVENFLLYNSRKSVYFNTFFISDAQVSSMGHQQSDYVQLVFMDRYLSILPTSPHLERKPIGIDSNDGYSDHLSNGITNDALGNSNINKKHRTHRGYLVLYTHVLPELSSYNMCCVGIHAASNTHLEQQFCLPAR